MQNNIDRLSILKHALIFISYILLFIGVLFWDWSIYVFLFSYLLEFFLLILVFIISHLLTFIKQEKATTKYNPFNVVTGSVFLMIMNYGIVFLITSFHEFTFFTLEDNTSDFMLYEILPSSILILIMFTISIFNLKKDKRQQIIDQNLIFQGVILTVINVIALLIFVELELVNTILGIGILVVSRLLAEMKFGDRMRLF